MVTNPYRLEICVDSWESVLAVAAAAEEVKKQHQLYGDPHRILRLEMCSALGLDGLSPSLALCALTHERFPWMEQWMMIRPRPGDFHYTTAEVEQMKCEIATLKPLAAGYVFGALAAPLDSEGRRRRRSSSLSSTPPPSPHGDPAAEPMAAPKIDWAVCQELIEAASPLPYTFHRAFDEIPSGPERLGALETISRLGFKRILTSGGGGLAEGSVDSEEARQDLKGLFLAGAPLVITIQAGGGVRPHNLATLADLTGVREFHSSASTRITSAYSPALAWRRVDPAKVEEMLRQLIDLDTGHNP